MPQITNLTADYGLMKRLTIVISLIAAGLSHAEPDGRAILANFASPPKETRPTVWWRFMDDYVTREGITADLDFMKRAGLSGGIVSFCSSRTRISEAKAGAPHVPILSKNWWDIIHFKLGEASKRDLDLWFQASPGYATSGGPWIQPEHSMQKVVWKEVTCDAAKGFDDILPQPAVDKKWNYYRDIAVLAFPDGKAPVAPEKVIDLTKRMDTSGRLNWKPDSGTWRIVRLGHTTTGKTVHPTTKPGTGLECDKLSREATRIQFDSYFKKIIEQRPATAKGGIQLFFDSWEAENQNWTPRFREEFHKRRGYDPLPWLLVATGKLVSSEELSRRFDYDWKTTIEEMINSEHFAELARLCHENGCNEFRAQPYNGPVNFMTAGALFDIPEGEFWHVNKGYGWWTLRMIASVSHVNGKKTASAEALTASPEHLRMDVDPFSTKAETDLAFTMGINRLAIPHIPHNPWPQHKPGMSAGPYGMLLGGGQIWADLAGSWVTYLSRCSYLLQQGNFAADVVTLFRPGQRGFEPPAGYAADICNEELIISSMTFDGESLCLPSGMRYKLLELVDTTKVLSPALSPSGIEPRLGTKPRPQTISLPLLKKVRELVHAGATVVGPRPTTAPGLSGYPACDQEIKTIADELWGPASATGAINRKVGKGRVFSNLAVSDVLSRIGVQPDFKTTEDVPWIHRRIGDDDFYFISNQKNEATKFTASFRVDGKVPEFWHADTGQVEPARSWTNKAGRSEVELDLPPRGSVFVRFRKGAAEKAVNPSVLGSIPLSNDWKVSFSTAMGEPEQTDFPKLISWTDHPQKEIRYYSGIATYGKSIHIPADLIKPRHQLLLDLGDVKNLARVTLNGTTFPELWKPPFTCDITTAAKPGANTLSIEVVNLWVNRLIGDEQEPADIQWGAPQYNPAKLYKGQPIEALPDWLLRNTPRPSSARRTFCTWNYVKKDQALLPSGLLGPVRIISTSEPR
jgi:hypothetical protein